MECIVLRTTTGTRCLKMTQRLLSGSCFGFVKDSAENANVFCLLRVWSTFRTSVLYVLWSNNTSLQFQTDNNVIFFLPLCDPLSLSLSLSFRQDMFFQGPHRVRQTGSDVLVSQQNDSAQIADKMQHDWLVQWRECGDKKPSHTTICLSFIIVGYAPTTYCFFFSYFRRSKNQNVLPLITDSLIRSWVQNLCPSSGLIIH